MDYSSSSNDNNDFQEMAESSSSVFIPQAAQDVINTIKAQYDEKVIAIARYYDENLQFLRKERNELVLKNHKLRKTNRHARETIQQKEKLLLAVSIGGAPSSEEPCSLCGRLTNKFAEATDEHVVFKTAPVGPWEPRLSYTDSQNKAVEEVTAHENLESQTKTDTQPIKSSKPNEQHDEYQRRSLIANGKDGKKWSESIGSYEYKWPAPEHIAKKAKHLAAVARRSNNEPKSGDDELLDEPVETEASLYGASRNFITGEIRTEKKVITYGNQDDRDSEEDEPEAEAQMGDAKAQAWTDEQMAFANSTITGYDYWSQNAAGWGVDHGAEQVDTSANGAGGED